MKLAVRKEQGSIPGGGFHYMLMPKRLDSEDEEAIWGQMGHIIIDVSDDVGERLLQESGAALRHQVEVAYLTEQTLKKNNEVTRQLSS